MTADSVVRGAVSLLMSRAGVTSYPIDLQKIASYQRATVEYLPLGSLLGSTTPGPMGIEIRINNDYPGESRFTLAHELAHTMLWPKAEGYRLPALATPSRNARTETFCDELAAEMLLPTRMVTTFLRKKAATPAVLIELSNSFDAPIEWAAVKFREQFAEAVVDVALWKKTGKFLSLEWPERNRLWGATIQLDGSYRVSRDLGDSRSAVVWAFKTTSTYSGTERFPGQEGNSSTHWLRTQSKAFGTGASRRVASVLHRTFPFCGTGSWRGERTSKLPPIRSTAANHKVHQRTNLLDEVSLLKKLQETPR